MAGAAPWCAPAARFSRGGVLWGCGIPQDPNIPKKYETEISVERKNKQKEIVRGSAGEH